MTRNRTIILNRSASTLRGIYPGRKSRIIFIGFMINHLSLNNLVKYFQHKFQAQRWNNRGYSQGQYRPRGRNRGRGNQMHRGRGRGRGHRGNSRNWNNDRYSDGRDTFKTRGHGIKNYYFYR